MAGNREGNRGHPLSCQRASGCSGPLRKSRTPTRLLGCQRGWVGVPDCGARLLGCQRGWVGVPDCALGLCWRGWVGVPDCGARLSGCPGLRVVARRTAGVPDCVPDCAGWHAGPDARRNTHLAYHPLQPVRPPASPDSRTSASTLAPCTFKNTTSAPRSHDRP